MVDGQAGLEQCIHRVPPLVPSCDAERLPHDLEIVGILTVDSVREVGGHAMVTTRSELSTSEGEPVCTATSTLVIRGGE